MQRLTAGLLTASLAGLMAACSGSPGPSSSSSETGSEAIPTVTCHSVSGTNDVGQKLTLAGCSGPTGGSGTVLGPFASPTVIHWASGGTTQVVFDSNTQVTDNPSCPTQLTATGGRVLSTSVHGITGNVRGVICIDSTGTISLPPGTTLTF